VGPADHVFTNVINRSVSLQIQTENKHCERASLYKVAIKVIKEQSYINSVNRNNDL